MTALRTLLQLDYRQFSCQLAGNPLFFFLLNNLRSLPLSGQALSNGSLNKSQRPPAKPKACIMGAGSKADELRQFVRCTVTSRLLIHRAGRHLPVVRLSTSSPPRQFGGHRHKPPTVLLRLLDQRTEGYSRNCQALGVSPAEPGDFPLH